MRTPGTKRWSCDFVTGCFLPLPAVGRCNRQRVFFFVSACSSWIDKTKRPGNYDANSLSVSVYIYIYKYLYTISIYIYIYIYTCMHAYMYKTFSLYHDFIHLVAAKKCIYNLFPTIPPNKNSEEGNTMALSGIR